MIDRQLDSLVAEKIFGKKYVKVGYGWGWILEENAGNRETRILPGYSSDINLSWEIVEKLGKDFNKKFSLFSDPNGPKYLAEFENRFYSGEPDTWHSGWVSHPAYAICLAALEVIKK